jgi:hypothetical protein
MNSRFTELVQLSFMPLSRRNHFQYIYKYCMLSVYLWFKIHIVCPNLLFSVNSPWRHPHSNRILKVLREKCAWADATHVHSHSNLFQKPRPQFLTLAVHRASRALSLSHTHARILTHSPTHTHTNTHTHTHRGLQRVRSVMVPSNKVSKRCLIMFVLFT